MEFYAEYIYIAPTLNIIIWKQYISYSLNTKSFQIKITVAFNEKFSGPLAYMNLE